MLTGYLLRLSRQVAHALRHRPERYGLFLDADGWVEIEALLAALARANEGGVEVTAQDLHKMIATADKQRFEIKGHQIRALYGHSTSNKIEMAPATPPRLLYHGTTAVAVARIRNEGLKPMHRQYVHLSPDVGTAKKVALRRTPSPVIITVRATQAHGGLGQTFDSCFRFQPQRCCGG